VTNTSADLSSRTNGGPTIRCGDAELPLIDVPCYMCGATEGEVQVDDPPFKVVRCASCSFVYVTPRVPDSHLHLIYQTDYFTSHNAGEFGYSDYTRDKKGYLKTFRRKAEFVHAHRPSGRVLEIGSAAGFFLFAMRELGYEANGVEISQYVVDYARDELNLDGIHHGPLETCPFPKGSYDIVALWDVIEHVPDPIEELKRIREYLRPDGLLVMQTQNVDASLAKILGRKWQHYKQLEHIHHFSPTTMKTALDRSGFELMETTTEGAGKYISVDFFVDRMRRYSRVMHYLLQPFRIAGRLFFYINPGDEIIVLARPREG